MIKDLLAAVKRRHGIEVQRILDARLMGDIERPGIVRPERDTEILVLLLVEIGPYCRYRTGKSGGHIDKADADIGVLLPHFRVMRLAELPVLAEGRIDREHRYFRVVEMIEGDALAVR